MKLHEFIAFFKSELKPYYSPEEIDGLLRYTLDVCLDMSLGKAIAEKNAELAEREDRRLSDIVSGLKKYIPVQHLTGIAFFYGLQLEVNSNVLIPRQETEELVHRIIRDTGNEAKSIIDIGTGSGCIAIALKKNLPNASLTALDYKGEALEIAERNAIRNNVELTYLQRSIFDPVSFDAKFDVIVSNPPYVREKEKELMARNVVDFEPADALYVPDKTPLIYYKRIIEISESMLKKGGIIYFEINECFGAEVKQLLEEGGYINIERIKDLNDKERIVKATYHER